MRMTEIGGTQALTIARQLKIFRRGNQLCVVFKDHESSAYLVSTDNPAWKVLDSWLRLKEAGGDVHPLYHVGLDLLMKVLEYLEGG